MHRQSSNSARAYAHSYIETWVSAFVPHLCKDFVLGIGRKAGAAESCDVACSCFKPVKHKMTARRPQQSICTKMQRTAACPYVPGQIKHMRSVCLFPGHFRLSLSVIMVSYKSVNLFSSASSVMPQQTYHQNVCLNLLRCQTHHIQHRSMHKCIPHQDCLLYAANRQLHALQHNFLLTRMHHVQEPDS